MQIKVHIPRLPIIPYTVPEAETDNRLAISIPLFHSDFQWVEGGIETKRFQQVHCKGAIWTALSLLWNTDLGAKGVRVYFHIEDTVWDIAMPIFAAFNVDPKWMRQMTIPNAQTATDVENVHYGKKFMSVMDKRMDADVLMIVDSDAFVCSAGRPLEWYQVLSSALFLKSPSTLEFQPILYNYEHWVKRCSNAVGIPYDPDIPPHALEKAVYAHIGLPYPFVREKGLHNAKVAMRPICSNAYITIPRKHRIFKFLATHFQQCYEDEYLLAMFAMVGGLMLSFKNTLDIRVFIETDEYLAFTQHRTNAKGYIHHLIFGSFNADPFFNRFFRDLTRNIPMDQPHLTEWRKFYD